MAIKDLPKYKDIRGTIRRKGRYPYVGTAVKDTHVVHHSLTKTGSPEAFANYHIDTNGWYGVAYHIVIQLDGTIYHCDDFDRRTYHAGDTNTRAIGTCLVGDFRKGSGQTPTKEQMESLYLVNRELYKELPNMKRTLGHQECPGYSWKNCPGDGWDYRKVIKGEYAHTGGSPIIPAPIPGTYTIQDGDTLWALAKETGITVDAIIACNPGIQPTALKVGQVINLGVAAPKPAPTQPAPAPKPTANTGVVTVVTTDLRLRKSPSTSGAIIRTLNKGEEYKFYSIVNGWYNLGGDQWAYGSNGAYLKEKGQSVPTPTPAPSPKAVVPYPGVLIRKGSKGKDVERVQRAVGVSADGIFGSGTEAAVKAYQRRKGLVADGVVGKTTWNTLF